MPDIKTPDTLRDLPSAIIENITTLATNGFALVVALAWNETVKLFVTQFINPHLGQTGELISLTLYSIVITLFAVFITMQLSAFQKKVEEIEDKILPHDIEDDELAEAASLAIGSTYKHFKGATVKILDVARHSETKEAMVAYTHLDTGETWVRPLTMFMEKVEVKGKWVPRFKKITTK